MEEQWGYQLRIEISGEFSEAARHNPADPAIKPLTNVLRKHDATMKSQFDAFADYVAEAEKRGPGGYPLYRWTKAVIEDPVKKAKYTKSFTLYAGGKEVYSKEIADALERDLQPFVGGPLITRLSRHDTNPANNPQMPARFRESGV